MKWRFSCAAGTRTRSPMRAWASRTMAVALQRRSVCTSWRRDEHSRNRAKSHRYSRSRQGARVDGAIRAAVGRACRRQACARPFQSRGATPDRRACDCRRRERNASLSCCRGKFMKLEPITRANRPGRKEVLMREDEAAALIKDGSIIIVGGFGTVNHPMPIIRALIRGKIRNLTVIGAATAGLELDLLIGAGCVKKVIAPYIGAELHAPVGNCFRHAAENDDIEVYETTEYLLYSQLDDAEGGIGFFRCRGGVGTHE